MQRASRPAPCPTARLETRAARPRVVAPQPLLQVALAVVAEQRPQRAVRAARRDERKRVRMRARDVEVTRECIAEAHADARHRHGRIGLQRGDRQQFVDQLRAVGRPHRARRRFRIRVRAFGRQRHIARVLRRARTGSAAGSRRASTAPDARLGRQQPRRAIPPVGTACSAASASLIRATTRSSHWSASRWNSTSQSTRAQKARRAQLREPRVEPAAVAAELVVVAIAEREHREVHAVEARGAAGPQRVPEFAAVVGRIAVAERARHQQHVLRAGERRRRIVGHARGADLEARVHQLRRVILGQRFDVAGLRRPQQHDLRPRAHDPHAAGRSGVGRRRRRRCTRHARRQRAAEQPGQHAVEPEPHRRRERRAAGSTGTPPSRRPAFAFSPLTRPATYSRSVSVNGGGARSATRARPRKCRCLPCQFLKQASARAACGRRVHRVARSLHRRT